MTTATLESKDLLEQLRKDFEAVRLRPQMYVPGQYVNGFHCIVDAVINKSVDLALAKRCSWICVTLAEDGGIIIEDDGPGLSTDQQVGVPLDDLEWYFADVYSRYQQNPNPNSPSATGCWGTYIQISKILSEWFRVETTWKGKRHDIAFQNGTTTQPLRDLGPTSLKGDRISFKVDSALFGGAEINSSRLQFRLREIACLIPGLRVKFRDEGSGEEWKYFSKNGAADLLSQLTIRDTWHCLPFRIAEEIPVKIEDHSSTLTVDIAFLVGLRRPGLMGYCNTCDTFDGGWHMQSFAEILLETLQTEAENSDLTVHDIERNFAAVIAIRILKPSWCGPRKLRLGKPELKTEFMDCCRSHFMRQRNSEPNWVKSLTKAIKQTPLNILRDKNESLRSVKKPALEN